MQFFASKIVIAKGLDREGYVTDSVKKKLFMYACRLLPRGIFHRFVKGPKNRGSFVHSFLGGASGYSKSVYPRRYMEGASRMTFEGSEFPVPTEYDPLLRILYGDYMQLPPPDERAIKQHAILVDLENSYEIYREYRDGMTFDIYNRSIR
jgi:lipopolysaccharide cholinephosphotransferase